MIWDGRGTATPYGFYAWTRRPRAVRATAGHRGVRSSRDGQSAFAQCCAMNMCVARCASRGPERRTAGPCSCEPGDEGRDLGIRQMCADAGIDQTLARTGVLRARHGRDDVLLNSLEGVPLYVIRHGNAEVPEVRSTALTLKAARALAVFIDYLQIVRATRRYDTAPMRWASLARRQAACDGARRARDRALATQRECERRDDRRPISRTCRSSGEIEQDGDVVLAVFRPEYYADKVTKYAAEEWKGRPRSSSSSSATGRARASSSASARRHQVLRPHRRDGEAEQDAGTCRNGRERSVRAPPEPTRRRGRPAAGLRLRQAIRDPRERRRGPAGARQGKGARGTQAADDWTDHVSEWLERQSFGQATLDRGARRANGVVERQEQAGAADAPRRDARVRLRRARCSVLVVHEPAY